MRSKLGIALVVCGAAAALAITALVLLGGDLRQGGDGSKVGEGARAGTREVARGEPQVLPTPASRAALGSSGEAAVSPQQIPAIWIVGKCVDIAGRAIVGAEIRSTDPNHPFVARSAADGRFAWLGESSEELAVERVNLEASAVGYAPSKRTTFVYGNVATEIPDLVLWRAARIDGIVRDEAGAPVSGADVWVQNLHESAPGPAAKSGPDGRFTAAAIARGETAVVAEHPKYGQSDAVTMDLAKSGDAREVVVRFSREVLARSIVGSVVGPHGEPCPGASVAVQITHETGSPRERRRGRPRRQLLLRCQVSGDVSFPRVRSEGALVGR